MAAYTKLEEISIQRCEIYEPIENTPALFAAEETTDRLVRIASLTDSFFMAWNRQWL